MIKEEFIHHTKGVATHIVMQTLNDICHGVDSRGCSKRSIIEDFDRDSPGMKTLRAFPVSGFQSVLQKNLVEAQERSRVRQQREAENQKNADAHRKRVAAVARKLHDCASLTNEDRRLLLLAIRASVPGVIE